MKEHEVPRLDDVHQAPSLEIDCFPWDTGLDRQSTRVQICQDGSALLLHFRAMDRHIESDCTELNGPVCRDSCVEFFASPFPEGHPRFLHYFNLEINACGTFLLEHHDLEGELLDKIASGQADELSIETDVEGPTRKPRPDDAGFEVSVRLPLSLLSDFLGEKVGLDAPWRANFYRCGAGSEYACWNRIEEARPAFHRPRFFGRLNFQP